MTTASIQLQPIHNEIRHENGRYVFYRDGRPFFVKGAVYWADPHGLYPMKHLQECGANAIRTGGYSFYKDFVEQNIEEADRLGMAVAVGLGVLKEWPDGFDYNDEKAVREQLEQKLEMVEKYKNHPCVMIWGIGNELSVRYTNLKVWDAVNQIAEAIKRIDPHHPTMTVIGNEYTKESSIPEIIKRCPAVDLLGINYYNNLEGAPQKLRDLGWRKPYLVTEWGPTGHWEVPKTSWSAAIEETSTEKAQRYLERYTATMLGDKEMCLGSYAFYWDQKQERTPTWYGMFLETGERTEAVDVMQYLWSGKWPENRAPKIHSFTIDGLTALDDVKINRGTPHEAFVEASDPDGDPLDFYWEVIEEQPWKGYAGRGEVKMPAIENLFEQISSPRLNFVAPAIPGQYRLFIYGRDGRGSAATANIPFLVNA